MAKSFGRSGCGLVVLILVVLVAGFFGGGPLPWAKARWETYRSRLAYAEGNYEQALARANVAIDERSDYRLAHYQKGLTQEKLRDHDGAIASYTRAVELDDSRAALALAYRGGIYARFGRWEQATAHFGRAVALEPDNATVRNHYGVALAEADRDAEALVHYDRAVELDPTSAVFLINRGRCKREAEALRDLDEAVRLKPDGAEGYAGRAGCHFQMKDAAAVADPDCLSALRLRAAYRESRKETVLACQDLARIVEKDPTDTEAQIRLLALILNIR